MAKVKKKAGQMTGPLFGADERTSVLRTSPQSHARSELLRATLLRELPFALLASEVQVFSLKTSHIKTPSNVGCFYMVRMRGLEPPRSCEH